MVDAAVRMVMAEKPDLIVLGGDYVTWSDRRYMTDAADALAPLTAPHGVIAVLGNHDDERDMPAALAAKGFTVLRDARTRLTIRGEPMDFAGIKYWTRKLTDIAHIVRGAVPHTILLAHTPKRLLEAQILAVPAVISGHTHGGQIVLPGVGAIAAREFPVIAGLAQRQGTTIFVSRGVGTVYVPVRINCPPEVAILTLDTVVRA
jgi:predicted MPP superfamily phosphohydrolase